MAIMVNIKKERKTETATQLPRNIHRTVDRALSLQNAKCPQMLYRIGMVLCRIGEF